MTDRSTPLAGDTLTSVSNALATLHQQHFGLEPGRVKAHSIDGMLVCVLHDVYTTVEKTLIGEGQSDYVREDRQADQLAVAGQYTRVVEEIIGREISSSASTVHFDPDLAIEIFLLEGDSSGDA